MKKNWKSLLSAISAGALLAACGGGGGATSNDVDLKITVPDIAQKKSKLSDQTTVESVSVTILDNDQEVVASEESGVYFVKVPGKSDIHIKVRLRHDNGNVMNFEKYVDDVEDVDHEINEETTKLAALLIRESSDRKVAVRELLGENKGVIDKLKAELDKIASRDFLNAELAANSDKSLDELTDTVETTIKRLEELQDVINKIRDRLDAFENGQGVELDVIRDKDVESDGEFGDDIDGDILSEIIVRPTDAAGISAAGEAGENEENHDVRVEVDEDGNLIVVKDGFVKEIGLVLPKNRVAGRFIEIVDDVLVMGVKKGDHEQKVELKIPADNKALKNVLALLRENNFISASFKVENEVKYVVKVFAEGVTRGVLAEMSDKKIVVILKDGTEAVFEKQDIAFDQPVEPNPITILPVETQGGATAAGRPISEEEAKENNNSDGENADPVIRLTGDVVNQNNGPQFEDGDIHDGNKEDDLFVRMDVENAIAETTIFRPEFELKIGDEVAVHWVIEGNYRIVVGVFPVRKNTDVKPPVEEERPEFLIDGKVTHVKGEEFFEMGDRLIKITADTKLSLIDGLSVGDVVIVHGTHGAEGVIHALSVEEIKKDVDPTDVDTDVEGGSSGSKGDGASNVDTDPVKETASK